MPEDRSSQPPSQPPTSPPPPSQPANPQLLAERYEFVRFVARGGMSSVYLARDIRLDRPVAVKVLYAGLADNPSFVERFRREALAAAKLNHPRIVRVYDSGRDKGTYFIVMEYIEGQTLSDVLKSEGQLGANTALRIAEDVAEALADAHKQNVIHRDIKPANIMFTPVSGLKVTDFGIARAVTGSVSDLTQAGTVMGTATYFSPEQAKGEETDYRTDIYSLGVVLYEMLAGHPPFHGEAPISVAYQHVNEIPVSLWEATEGRVSADISNVVSQLLAKNPAERYQDAELLRADFTRLRLGQTPAGLVVASPAFSPPPAAPASAPEAAPVAQSHPRQRSPRQRPARQRAPRQRAPRQPRQKAARQQSPEQPPRQSRRQRQPSPAPGPALSQPPSQPPAPTRKPPPRRQAGRQPPRSPRQPPARRSSAPGRSQPPRRPPPPRRQPLSPEEIRAVRQRRRTVLFWAFFALIIVSLVAIITIVLTAGDNNENNSDTTTRVDLPSVLRQTEEEASRTLDNLGFAPIIQREENTIIPAGQVIRQDPRAGAKLLPGTEVTIFVSLGDEAIAIPDIVGYAVADARRVLEGAEFGFDALAVPADSCKPQGEVVAMSPEAGEQRAPGTQIVMSISNGRCAVLVPDVTGMLQGVAITQLERLRLEYTIRDLPSNQMEAGRVIQTNPAAGARVVTGEATVELFVSSGLDTTLRMPSVLDLSEAEARRELEDVGLLVRVEYTEALSPQNIGRVISQDPAPESGIDLDNVATIFVGEEAGTEIPLRPGLES